MNRLDTLLESILDHPLEGLDESLPFAEVCDWDSIRQVQLVVGLQSTFEIDLTREEIQGLRSIADARSLLSARGITA